MSVTVLRLSSPRCGYGACENDASTRVRCVAIEPRESEKLVMSLCEEHHATVMYMVRRAEAGGYLLACLRGIAKIQDRLWSERVEVENEARLAGAIPVSAVAASILRDARACNT